MKCTLIALSALLLVFGAYAQKQTFENEYLNQNRQKTIVLDLLKQQFSRNTQEKPTGTKQRVIAQTYKGATFKDSCIYSYSGSRGSTFNYNLFSYNTILNNIYAPSFIYTQSMNAMDLLADTITNYSGDTFRYKDFGIYRPDNKLSLIMTQYDDDYPFDRNKSEMTYNSNNLLDKFYFSMYDVPGPIDTNFLYKSTYSNGKITVDSFWQKEGGVWSLTGFAGHHYNAAGKFSIDSNFAVSGTDIQLSYTTQFEYYPDGKLSKINTIYFGGDTASNINQDSLGYTFGADYATYWENKQLMPLTGSLFIRREIRYPGANGIPDSAKVLWITAASQQLRTYRYHYNSYGNPENISIFKQGNNTTSPDETYAFYYELYDNGLTIKDIENDTDFTVYPNPFDNHINIDLKSLYPGEYYLKLISITGREVFSQVSKCYAKPIVVKLPELTEGVYLLEVKMQTGKILKKKLLKNLHR